MAVCLYDYKADDQGLGGQMAYLVTLAARHGYQVNVFAPVQPYSCVINPLDFLKDTIWQSSSQIEGLRLLGSSLSWHHHLHNLFNRLPLLKA